MINAKINFLEGAVDLKLYSTKKNLTRHLEFFFQNTELKGKRVLDIGGGSGLLSYWAIVNVDLLYALNQNLMGVQRE